MFRPLGLFREIDCPEGASCTLLNCLFAHSNLKTVDVNDALPSPTSVIAQSSPKVAITAQPVQDGPRKRRRISPEPAEAVASTASSATSTSEQAEKQSKQPVRAQPLNKANDSTAQSHEGSNVRTAGSRHEPNGSTSKPASAQRAISPPLQHGPAEGKDSKSKTAQSASNPVKTISRPNAIKSNRPPAREAESLNPRMLAKPPAAHAMRLKLVTMMHEQMTRLNDLVQASDEPFRDTLILTAPELIALVLDEEERIARTQPAVYSNVLRLRIVALKKMDLRAWCAERETQIAKDQASLSLQASPQTSRPETAVPRLDTGLTPAEEIAMLPVVITPQKGLEKHGYIPSVPAAGELDETRRALDMAQGWEPCDRCRTRFQVFPGRRAADGALTTPGRCTYHYGRKQKPVGSGPGGGTMGHGGASTVLQYSCCLRDVGSSGCTVANTHVFKASDPKRLSLVLPFIKTPNPDKDNGGRRKHPNLLDEAYVNTMDDDTPMPVCFDCEMGYTTNGMELIRITALAWPSGHDLLDVLVRPMGEILDLNSRYSGVWPEDMTAATPWTSTTELPPKVPPSREQDKTARTATDDAKDESSETQTDSIKSQDPLRPSLYIVSSPVHARTLFLQLLTPSTPLIGHALENDLNAIRLVHPNIVDTALLFPHPRGLPARRALRTLVQDYLQRTIQNSDGGRGHDSSEDARAAGDLVRWAIRERWTAMRAKGWRVRRGIFYAPDGERVGEEVGVEDLDQGK